MDRRMNPYHISQRGSPARDSAFLVRSQRAAHRGTRCAARAAAQDTVSLAAPSNLWERVTRTLSKRASDARGANHQITRLGKHGGANQPNLAKLLHNQRVSIRFLREFARPPHAAKRARRHAFSEKGNLASASPERCSTYTSDLLTTEPAERRAARALRDRAQEKQHRCVDTAANCAGSVTPSASTLPATYGAATKSTS